MDANFPAELERAEWVFRRLSTASNGDEATGPRAPPFREGHVDALVALEFLRTVEVALAKSGTEDELLEHMLLRQRILTDALRRGREDRPLWFGDDGQVFWHHFQHWETVTAQILAGRLDRSLDAVEEALDRAVPPVVYFTRKVDANYQTWRWFLSDPRFKAGHVDWLLWSITSPRRGETLEGQSRRRWTTFAPHRALREFGEYCVASLGDRASLPDVLPPRPRLPVGWQTFRGETLEDLFERFERLVSNDLATARSYGRSLALARLAIGIERFRLDHGALPAAIERLVPTYVTREVADLCRDGWESRDGGAIRLELSGSLDLRQAIHVVPREGEGAPIVSFESSDW